MIWPSVYQATAKIALDPPAGTSPAPTHSDGMKFQLPSLVKAQAEVIRSDSFLTKIAGQNGLASRWGVSNGRAASRMKRSTSVKRRTQEIEINYRSGIDTESAEIANVIATAYVDHWKRMQRDRYDDMEKTVRAEHDTFKSSTKLKLAAFEVLGASSSKPEELLKARDELRQLKERNAEFHKRLADIDTGRSTLSDAATIAMPATPGTVIEKADVFKGLITAAGVALLATLITVLIWAIQDRRKSSIADIAKALVPPNLVLIPETEKADYSDQPMPFLQIRQALVETYPQPEGVIITTVGCLAEESMTYISTELAHSLAAIGHPTLVIEGDLKNPTVHKRFGLETSPGLTDHLLGEKTLGDVAIKTDVENLWVVPGGGEISAEPETLLRSTQMKEMLTDASSRFDYIIFSGAPIVSGTTSLLLSELSHETYVCTDSTQTSKQLLVRTRIAIDQTGGQFAGLILTQVSAKAAADATEELVKADIYG